MENIELEELQRVARLIEEKYNYDFKDYAMSSFRRRVQRVLELYKLRNIDTLLSKLGSEAFFKDFISEITVNVTEMFRDPGCWKTIRDQVIPNILKTTDEIRIWHAGCSSGEEVFTMLILLDEMGLAGKARIFATDIDRVIIDKAKKNIISEKNMEVNLRNYETFEGKKNLVDYFHKVNSGYKFKDEYLSHVSFIEHDLVLGSPFNDVDLALCRNVMIYFNQPLQNKVLTKIHNSLKKYGYLSIGSKESLIWCDISHKFIVTNNEEKIYKKIKD